MAVTRRVFSAGLIVFNLVIKHDAAHAQAAILSKIPWGRIMEGLRQWYFIFTNNIRSSTS